MRPAEPRSGRYGRLVQPRTPSVVSIWLVVPDGRPIRRLQHELQTTGTPTAVSEVSLSPEWSEPLVLGPPFRQGLWLSHNGPGAHRAAHWGSMLVSGRRITVPQRYAIDFMGLDDNGRGARRAMEGSANADWSGFGRDVIAVANGVVRESRDGVVDEADPPLSEPPPPRDAELANVGAITWSSTSVEGGSFTTCTCNATVSASGRANGSAVGIRSARQLGEQQWRAPSLQRRRQRATVPGRRSCPTPSTCSFRVAARRPLRPSASCPPAPARPPFEWNGFCP